MCVRTGLMWLTIWINSGPENLTGSETGADFLYYMTDRRLKANPVGTGTHCSNDVSEVTAATAEYVSLMPAYASGDWVTLIPANASWEWVALISEIASRGLVILIPVNASRECVAYRRMLLGTESLKPTYASGGWFTYTGLCFKRGQSCTGVWFRGMSHSYTGMCFREKCESQTQTVAPTSAILRDYNLHKL
jgi:hypothetical protein